MSKLAASCATGASPARRRSRIARRVGSATARKGSALAVGRGTVIWVSETLRNMPARDARRQSRRRGEPGAIVIPHDPRQSPHPRIPASVSIAVHPSPNDPTRATLVRRGLRLNYLGIGYNLLEAVI